MKTERPIGRPRVGQGHTTRLTFRLSFKQWAQLRRLKPPHQTASEFVRELLGKELERLAKTDASG